MIDFDRKLIFIHIPKTGGSAIEAALLGDERIMDHDHPERFGLFLEQYKDNFCNLSHPHASISEYRKKLGSSFKDYKVFTVVRNPWDTMLSSFCYLFKYKDRAFFTPKNFQKFVSFRLEMSYSSLIGARNEQLIDYVLSYHDLENELNRMLRDLNLSSIKIPFGNKSFSSHLNDQDFYSEEAKKMIEKNFWYEITRFDWKYGSKKPKTLNYQDLSVSIKAKLILKRFFHSLKVKILMNKNQHRSISFLKAIKGRLFSTKKNRKDFITATACSHPATLPGLQFAIESILGQVDLVCVYLNNIEVIPKWLQHPKVRVVCSKHAVGDLKSDGGHFFSDSLEGYCFAIDDDIIYPPDYVETMIRKIESYKRKAIICVHAGILRYPFNSFYQSNITLWYFDSLKEDIRVDLGSNGTLAYHTDTIRYKLSDFSRSNTSDIDLSVTAARKNIPIFAISRKRGWLRRNYPPFGRDQTIIMNWEKYDKVTTDLIKKNLGLFAPNNFF